MDLIAFVSNIKTYHIIFFSLGVANDLSHILKKWTTILAIYARVGVEKRLIFLMSNIINSSSNVFAVSPIYRNSQLISQLYFSFGKSWSISFHDQVFQCTINERNTSAFDAIFNNLLEFPLICADNLGITNIAGLKNVDNN